MPTPAQEAFAEGFASLQEDHGQTWSFGDLPVPGVATSPRVGDPRFPGGADEIVELLVAPTSMPSGVKVGSTFKNADGVRHTVKFPPRLNPATGLWSVVLAS